MTTLIYQELASRLTALANCRTTGDTQWNDRHGGIIMNIMESAPSGSGFDSGTSIDIDDLVVPNSNGKSEFRDVLKFNTTFHHMDQNGMYCGWTEHMVTVRPSLLFEFTISISGPNRDSVKDFIHDMFDTWLRSEYTCAP
jgi:hypothetical protein